MSASDPEPTLRTEHNALPGSLEPQPGQMVGYEGIRHRSLRLRFGQRARASKRTDAV